MRAASSVLSGNFKPNVGRKLIVIHTILFLLSFFASLWSVLAKKAAIGDATALFFVGLLVLEFLITPAGWITLVYLSKRHP